MSLTKAISRNQLRTMHAWFKINIEAITRWDIVWCKIVTWKMSVGKNLIARSLIFYNAIPMQNKT